MKLIFTTVLGSAALGPLVTAGVVETQSPERTQSSAQAARQVDTTTVLQTDLSNSLDVIGNVEPLASVTLLPRVDGYLTEVSVLPGDRLDLGAPVARLAVPGLAAQQKALQASADEASALVRDAEAGEADALADIKVAQAAQELSEADSLVAETQVSLSRKVAERTRALFDRGAATQETLDEAEGELALAQAHQHAAVAAQSAAKARVGAAEARARAARAGIDSAQAMARARQERVGELDVMLGFAELTNPFTQALVTRRWVDPGTLARSGETRIATLMDVSSVLIFLDIPESSVTSVKAGSVVELSFDAFPRESRSATITRVSGALDPMSRSMHAEIELQNADGSLMPGMFCHAIVEVDRRPAAWTVPGSAIYARGTETWVMVAEAGVARRRDVEIGLDDGLVVEIRKGLRGTERVILGRPAGIEDGDAIRYVGSGKGQK